tara:strand:+ start:799 stop:1425 length:627 start_codon:yes stop_codon:yes gene_type:complete
LKTPINKNHFYYNELASKITDDIFNNLNDGIKWDQTQYEWPYDLIIDKEEDFRYLNFSYEVKRIPKKDFIKNDIVGSSGLDEICMPHVKIHMLMQERKWIKNYDYEYAQVIGVIAHELHHLAQDFDLVRYHMPDNLVEYFLNPIEVEAFHVGFRAESAQSSKSIEECIRKYLDNFLHDDGITKQEYENIVVKWLKPEIKLLKGVNNES